MKKECLFIEDEIVDVILIKKVEGISNRDLIWRSLNLIRECNDY